MTDISGTSSWNGLSAPPIQLGGLSSGLDTNAVIQALTATDQFQETQLTWKQAADNAEVSDLNDVKTKLQALQTAIQALQDPGTWAPSQSVTSTDSTKVSAQITGGAAPGGYSIAVTQLATSSQHTFSYTANATSDTTVTIGSTNITIPANSTADEVAATINSASAGVVAIHVVDPSTGGDDIVLASTATGSNSDFTATGSTLTEQTSKARVGLDAQFTINGETTPEVTHTNTVDASTAGVSSNFPAGVSLTLLATTSGTGINVSTPTVNTTLVQTNVTNFVNAYNAAMSDIRGYTSQLPVANPQNATDESQGVLYGDMGLSDLMDQLRQSTGQEFTAMNNTSMDQLAQMGVSTGATTGSGAYSQDAVNGTLVIDTTALSAALASNPTGVQKLLGGLVGGPDGLSQTLSNELNPYIESGGLIDNEIQGAQSEAQDVGDQITQWQQRITDEQNTLRTEFTNMETSLNTLKGQGSAMDSSLYPSTTSSTSSSSGSSSSGG